MKHLFGISYMGSKTKIALDIHKQLPSGKRFVDLFGGGFAMSHSALLLNKYDQVLYNDFNALLVDLVRDAIAGKYNYNIFKPEFITREMFNELKDKDGYVKYVWSFGNDGNNYLFGQDVEPIKKVAHNFIVFNKYDPLLDQIDSGIKSAVKSQTIHERRLELQAYCRERTIQCERIERLQRLERLQNTQQLQQIEQLQRLERLQNTQQLQQIERLQRLEITNTSYLDYKYKDGDIVYCDPPYENTSKYDNVFDHKQFYDWIASRPYQVWFSSYKISDKRFKIIWARELRTTRGGAGNTSNFECLYTNKS